MVRVRELHPDEPGPPVLVRNAWAGTIISSSEVHRAPPGPLVITAYSADELSDVLQWASASQLSQPATCVDLSGPLDADTQVLVTRSRRPGVSSCRVKLHVLSEGGPLPATLKPEEGLDDKPLNSTPGASGPATTNVRITLAREYSDQARFVRLAAKPQGLLGSVLPASLAAKVIKSFAFAAYADEVTCLATIRAADLGTFSATKFDLGVFVAPQRCADMSVQWLSRDSKLTAGAYLQKARLAVEASSGGTLAYRPGGRSNLGIRSSKPPCRIESAIPPRFSLAQAPATWLAEDVAQWLKDRGFQDAANIQRVSADTWFFRAWPPADHAGTAVFSSGIVVAPASHPQRARKQAAKATAAPVWGARAKVPQPEPETQDDDALMAPAETSAPKDGTPEAPKAPDPLSEQSRKESRSRSRSRSPIAKDTAAPVPTGSTPAFPKSHLFQVRECGGFGDCAFTFIATALAKFARYHSFFGRPRARGGGSRVSFVVKLRLTSKLTPTCTRTWTALSPSSPKRLAPSANMQTPSRLGL